MAFQVLLRMIKWCATVVFLLNFTTMPGQPACRSCPFPPCPCPCTLDEIAATIIPLATPIDPDWILPAQTEVIVRRNQVLFIHTFTPTGQTTAVTTYLPIKQFGNTGLYFYRLPEPGQAMGGWTPCIFWSDAADSTLPPLWAAYFKCNRLPYLSPSEVNQIAQLFLPGCCCPPCL